MITQFILDAFARLIGTVIAGFPSIPAPIVAQIISAKSGIQDVMHRIVFLDPIVPFDVVSGLLAVVGVLFTWWLAGTIVMGIVRLVRPGK